MEDIDLYPYEIDGEEIDSYVLLKFMEKEEYLNDFLNGKLYFNTAEFFAQCDDEGRGDDTEGTKFIVPEISPDYKSANLEMVNGVPMIVCRDYSKNPDEYKPSTVLSYIPVERNYRKLISFFALKLSLKNNTRANISPNVVKDFGEYGGLIIDRKEFYRRVAKALETKKKAQLGFVEYSKKEEEKGYLELNPFKKKSKFSEQNEVRFTFIGDTTEAEFVHVGDLHDIAFPISAEYLNEIQVKEHSLIYPICEFVETGYDAK